MSDTIREYLKQTLFKLCSCDGPSGCETDAVSAAMAMFEPYGEIMPLGLGSFACIINKDAKQTVLFDAHIDEISMAVTSVNNGFVHVAPIGGVDRRVLLSQEVIIHAKQDIPGVFGTIPPHLMKPGEDSKYPEFENYIIDTGLGEQAQQLISVGDLVTLRRKPHELLNGRLTSKATDDRAGVAVLLGMLKILNGNYNDTTVICLISSQEEVGERGAKTACFSLEYDKAIAVDVSFADAPDVERNKVGVMGKGPMIGISPFIDRGIYDSLVNTANKLNIPWQAEVMGGATGTDIDVITTEKHGCAGGLVSIPQRNMHTPAEIVDLSDLEHCSALLAGYINGGDINEQ